MLKGALCDFKRHLVMRLQIAINRSYDGRQEKMSSSKKAESGQLILRLLLSLVHHCVYVLFSDFS